LRGELRREQWREKKQIPRKRRKMPLPCVKYLTSKIEEKVLLFVE
jgi:hypothetical protein